MYGSVYLIASFVFMVGTLLGSFANVCIHRLPPRESVCTPRSYAPCCGRRLRSWHLVPVLSWIALRGRCAYCRSAISLHYPVVELLGGGLALLVYVAIPDMIPRFSAWLFFFGLLVVFFTDWRERIIPDEISLGGVVLGLMLSPWTIGLVPALTGSAAGGVSFYLIGWFYKKASGQVGMGLGDVKLAFMLGAFLGPAAFLAAVLLASTAGSILGLSLIRFGRASSSAALPFGSLLAPAAVLALFKGAELWSWYHSLF
ncbi:MAG: prepilin peptidase [Candidatus Nomurabacteria bacterium]|nr:MAG: prepilin peptidase [Candidatus Nomurabacteria bacterium]